MENKNNSILNLMVSHHALLEALFVLFRDEVAEKSPRAGNSLAELIWETKKHFFTEENAIFDFVPLENVEILTTINHLKDEHLIMLSNLSGFAEDLSKVTSDEVDAFYKMLEDHRQVEEKELYPKLDEKMREEQKAQVILHINQIPLKDLKK